MCADSLQDPVPPGPCTQPRGIMISRGHAHALSTGTSKVFRMSGAIQRSKGQRRKLWDSQGLAEMFPFVGSRLEGLQGLQGRPQMWRRRPPPLAFPSSLIVSRLHFKEKIDSLCLCHFS